MSKTVFFGGVWNKKELDKDIIDVKDALYVAPTKDGAYLGINTPNKSGEEINNLFEIHYSNPNFFRDYRNHSTELGQEGIWIGTNLKLKKIKDTVVKIPKRERASKKPLRYRYIVAEVDEENSERTPTDKEYNEVLREFREKYNKPCYPDELDEAEKKFFYNSIQNKVRENNLDNLETGKEHKTLETFLKVASIIAFFTGVLFLSSTFTGNVIGNLPARNNSIIGILLLVVCSFLYFFSTKRKNYKFQFPKNNSNISHNP